MSTILFHVLSPNATVNQETTYSHSMSLHALATNLDSLTPLTPSGALNFYIPLCQHLLRRIQVIEKNRDPIELPTLQTIVDTLETALVLYLTHLRPALQERLSNQVALNSQEHGFEPLDVLNRLFRDATQLASHYREAESQLRLIALESLYDPTKPIQDPIPYEPLFDVQIDMTKYPFTLLDPVPSPIMLPTAVSFHDVFGPMTPQPLEHEPTEYPFTYSKPPKRSRGSNNTKHTSATPARKHANASGSSKKFNKHAAPAKPAHTPPQPSVRPASSSRYSLRSRAKSTIIIDPFPPLAKKRGMHVKKNLPATTVKEEPSTSKSSSASSVARSTSEPNVSNNNFNNLSSDELTPLPLTLSPVKSNSASPITIKHDFTDLASTAKSDGRASKRVKREDESPTRHLSRRVGLGVRAASGKCEKENKAVEF